MTNKQMKYRLAEAAESLKPNVSFDRIAQAVPVEQNMTAIVTPRSRRPICLAVATVAACLIAVLGLGILLLRPNEPNAPTVQTPVAVADAIIDIDVNPSVELAVDDADRILSAVAVNSDGRQVLEGLTLEGQPLVDGVASLFEAMVAHGYVGERDNVILVTVQSADQTEADRLHDIVNDGVDAVMAQHDLTAAVSHQTVEAFDAVTDFARRHGISNGKAAFILGLVEHDAALDTDALAEYPFTVLAAIAQHKGLSPEDLVDYDAVDGLNRQLAQALEQDVAEMENALSIELISPGTAKMKALSTLRDWEAIAALLVKAELVMLEGEPVYQMEFIVCPYVLEFAVNAVDGSLCNPNGSTITTNPHGIIQSTLVGGGTAAHFSDPPKTTTSPPTTTTTTTTTTATATRPAANHGALTDEQAKDRVLFRLGATEAEVQNLSVGHHPYRNELSVYLIYNRYIYCFYFDITTGDETKTVMLPVDVAIGNYCLDEWDALQIALDDVNLTEGECGEITIVYYVHNDAPFIAVGWVANNASYQYHIDGVDGDVARKTVTPLGGVDTPPSMVIP